jgi:hypothetical protein
MNRLKTIILSLVISSTAMVSVSQKAFALSPPWFVLQSQFKATLEGDPSVEVRQLRPIAGGYELEIDVHAGKRKAQALSTFLSKTHVFGGVSVFVEVFDSRHRLVQPGTIPTQLDDLSKLIRTALKGNRFFVKIDPGNGVYSLFVEFTKSVVQYFADNLADAYKNINQVAADAFAQVFDFPVELKVGTSTSPECQGHDCEDDKSGSK